MKKNHPPNYLSRRKFLKTAGMAAAIAPLTMNGYTINPMSGASLYRKLGGSVQFTDRVMVFIELNGGNDGLNTLIPLDQYNKLSVHRPRVLIPESAVLPLTGTAKTGLHPAMQRIRQLYDNGMVSVVQRVGYPDQDYSHFRSMDIWMTASDSDEALSSGWLGRMLEQENQGYPSGYPNSDAPDPLAINVGTISPVSLMGNSFPMGISVGDVEQVYNLINDFVEPAPSTPYGDELAYIRAVMQNTKVYFDVIKEAALIGQNLTALYPAAGENALADQLRVVARLISGGLQTPVYVVSIHGFDTHAEQVEAGDPLSGVHAVLLNQISEAVYAFMDDVRLMGKANQVCAMTYSEFGRTVTDNLSYGTDHGAGAPLFVFGKGVIPGIIGDNPVIQTDVNLSEDVPMQHDFRQVYASVIQDWFGIANPGALLQGDFAVLPIFKASTRATDLASSANFELRSFPNPVAQVATIAFTIPEAMVRLDLLDSQGRFLRLLSEGRYPAGFHKVVFNREGLPSGQYFYVLRVNGLGITKKLLLI
jgi:uncharacterized protein (DUF1501 family)